MTKYSVILLIMIAFWIQCTTSTIQKTEEDSATTVELKKDQYLDVVLSANPTTGYQWEIINMDTTILIHSGTEYQPDEAPPGILGTGGKTIFHLNIGDPVIYDFQTPKYISQAVADATFAGHNNYVDSLGVPELREEICKYEKKKNLIDITPDDILIIFPS